MTIDELLAELPALGPWRTLGSAGVLRDASGYRCPLAAVAHARGAKVTYGEMEGSRAYRFRTKEESIPTVFGPVKLGELLGIIPQDAEDIADAADGAAARFHPELASLRRRLLVACGLGAVADREEIARRVA